MRISRHTRHSSTYLNSAESGPRLQNAFTLVEFLVVMTIITILLAVGIPLLSDPSASARKSTRDIVRAQLQQARAHSIATGNPTAVMIPEYATATAGGRLIGVAEVEAQPAGTSPYKVTKLIQRWTQLPDTIFFFDQSIAGISQPTILDASERIQASYLKKTINCHYIIFGPNGQIISPPAPTSSGGSRLVLAIGKGILSQNTVTPTQKTQQGVSFDLLQINRLSARARNLVSTQ